MLGAKDRGDSVGPQLSSIYSVLSEGLSEAIALHVNVSLIYLFFFEVGLKWAGVVSGLRELASLADLQEPPSFLASSLCDPYKEGPKKWKEVVQRGYQEG